MNNLNLWRAAGFALNPNDMRALSPFELQQQAIAEMARVGGAAQSLSDMNMLMNYRRPTYVPPGWADWYSCGDQLH